MKWVVILVILCVGVIMSNQIISLTMAQPKVSVPTEKAVDVTSYQDGGGSSFNGADGSFSMQKSGMATYILRSKMLKVAKYWVGSGSPPNYTAWNGSAWVFNGEDVEGGWRIYTNPDSDWATGFRPTKIRLTFTYSDISPGAWCDDEDLYLSLWVVDTAYANASQEVYESGDELDLSIGDIATVALIGHCSGWVIETTVTAIDFFINGVWESYLYEE